MRELHFTKKDFSIEWFSGTGGGGQDRNKHQNCCRITHLATGLKAVGQTARDRPTNQRIAFTRNEVIDKTSGMRLPYRDVVVAGELGELIKARKRAKELGLAGGKTA